MRAIAYGASVLALMGLAAPAAADTVPFVDTTPGPGTFTAPETGVYDILAFGAQGGAGTFGHVGGLGAEVGGDFALTAGETLSIVVGGMGGAAAGANAGGGGGTFVLTSTGTALLIAGGGGGSGLIFAGGSGLISGNGGNGLPGGSRGGVDGNGGGGGPPGGGGGLNGAGDGDFGSGGAAAGGPGGLGGGGSGGGGGAAAAAAARRRRRGFSGGGGGQGGGAGGGGGSLNPAFANIIAKSGVRSGDGELDIDLVPPAVPEPSTWAMLLLGFAGLGALAYRRRSGSRPAKA